VLGVPRDGLFFNNHGSVPEEKEFVCHEVAKLLASGAVTQLRRDDKTS